MSTAISAPVPEAAPPVAREIGRPFLWLLAIVGLGLVLRGLQMRDLPVEVDEFTSLSAVAERQGLDIGTTPTVNDPLVPVASLGEVSHRSVIPFGLEDPVPLYHDLLWAVAHVLPIADWSMRLPSLLAGLGCIVAVFFLVKRTFGVEMALAASLFVALDPIQVNTSVLVRPFALGNLAAVLSFVSLWGVLHATSPRCVVLQALGYAVCVAALGYFSPLLLFVVLAHAGMVWYAARNGVEGASRRAAFWGGALALALLLLAPELPYLGRVSAWGWSHNRYLTAAHNVHLFTPFVVLFMHNLVFLGGLALILIAGYIVRMQLQGGDAEPKAEGEAQTTSAESAAAAPAGGSATAIASAPTLSPALAAAPAPAAAPPVPLQPLPENDEALWMGRVWLFLPQAGLLVASLVVSSIFTSRALTYTTIGAAILLAYYATRDGSREARIGLVCVLAVGLLLFGFLSSWSRGSGLVSNDKALAIMGKPGKGEGLAGTVMNEGVTTADGKVEPPLWKSGDVVLMRSGLIEADFLRTEIPEAARPQVERAILAPLTLLYPDSSNKPVMALTFSEYHNQEVKTPAGDQEQVKLDAFYDAAFAERLKSYQRYRMTGLANPQPNTWYYLSCIVPWMADHLDRGDLVVSRMRKDPAEHYVVVKPGLSIKEKIKGLTDDRQPGDFDNILHIVRKRKSDDNKGEKKEEKKK